MAKIVQISQLFYTQRAVNNVYLHLPFCIKKCHFCAFPIHALGNQPTTHLLNEYILQIQQEIRIAKNHWNMGQELESLYFGGGTPSLHSKEQLEIMLQNFKIDQNSQVTIEINPSEINRMQEFLRIGFNRISLGIQTFNKTILDKVNRYNAFRSREQIQSTIMENRPRNISVDFILNFCLDTQDFSQMLAFIEQIRPEHITIYVLQINEGSKMFSHPKSFQWLPDEQKIVKRYIELCQRLQSLGYDHYEVSNFRINDKFGSKHNKIYWEGDYQYLAFGMGATSLTQERRITRPKTISSYYRYIRQLSLGKVNAQLLQIKQEISIKDKLQSIILSGIRRSQGISWSKIDKICESSDISQKLRNSLRQMDAERTGIINMRDLQQRVQLVSKEGLLLSDYIAFRMLQSLKL